MTRALAPSLLLALLAASACSEEHPLVPLPGEAFPGGDTTVVDDSRFAFSNRARNLDDARAGDFFVGNSFFKQNWVQAPASTEGRDGLGPTFNARSCSTCHEFDGRGEPPAAGEVMQSMLLRLSVPGTADDGGPLPEPDYGGQLQPFAIDDVLPEATPTVSYTEMPGRYGDGSSYSLRVPSYAIDDPGYGPLAADLQISPRVAPQMIGLGLLAAIPEHDIVARADPDDRDGDGIAGRPNHPFDPVTGSHPLGRFGWKANQVGLLQQVTGALLGDMGITSELHPHDDCPVAQGACAEATSGGTPEAAANIVEAMVFYSSVLAPPGRRDVDDPEVLAGRELFDELGCASCHVPSWITGDDAIDPALAGQLIWPFTDLLLHDLGEPLSDGRSDYEADPRAWRTPPLWGLGLVPTVSDHETLLHDGRARGFAEAILWHGGEAETARESFRMLPADQRAQLLAFLASL
jgi:CxxC motif-containing protein (DUF1111 family)